MAKRKRPKMEKINPAIADLRDAKASELKKTIRAEAMRMALGFHSSNEDRLTVDEILNSAKKMFDFMEYGSVPPLPMKDK